jgi:hypothetical protein
MRRGRVYYGKLARKSYVSRRGWCRTFTRSGASVDPRRRPIVAPARAILKVLRKEWEMASSDLRKDSGVADRATFTRAIDELQAAMIVAE